MLPLLFLSTLMSATDKVILGTAATFGLQTDLNLVGQDYSWANSMSEFHPAHLLPVHDSDFLSVSMLTPKFTLDVS